MTRPSNPANYECKGKLASDMNRGYPVHRWQVTNGVARCINQGCGLVLSKEDTIDLVNTRSD